MFPFRLYPLLGKNNGCGFQVFVVMKLTMGRGQMMRFEFCLLGVRYINGQPDVLDSEFVHLQYTFDGCTVVPNQSMGV